MPSMLKPSDGPRGVQLGRALVMSALSVIGGCNGKIDLSAYLHREVTAEPASSAVASVLPVASAQPAPPASAAPVAAPPAVVHPAPPADVLNQGAPLPTRVQSPLSPSGVLTLPTPYAAGPPSPTAPLAREHIASSPPAAATARRIVSIGGGAVSGGNISNASRVLARLRVPLRGCYERETSSGTGSIRFIVTVGPSGEVTNVTTTVGGDLPTQLAACATSLLKTIKFEAPEGGSATIQFPARFAIEGIALDTRPAKNESKARASGL
jgi:hypothetical protein